MAENRGEVAMGVGACRSELRSAGRSHGRLDAEDAEAGPAPEFLESPPA